MIKENTTAPGTGAPPEESVFAAPTVIPREKHCISRRDIDPDALKVLYRLARNNYTAYLVGGGVRDLLLRRRPKDFDISTNARPDQIKSLFKNCLLIGRRFRLAHIRYGDKIIETSTFRRAPLCEADPNDPAADLFQRDDNLFGSPEEDARRRDFTVNGLFYDIESFGVIDYVGGVDDLEKRHIRAIGDPGIRFREDPVRMVRAVRFASRLGFDIEEETLAALARHREEIAKASPARLLEEIARLFAFSSGERAVRLLRATGLLKVIMPEVDAFLDESSDQESFWRRLAALDRGDTVLPEATQAVIFAALFSDPIRFALRGDDFSDNPGHNVERVRSYLAPLAERLRFPRKLTDRLTRILLAQPRLLTPGRKRFSPAGLVQQDWFQEALALTEINAAVDGAHQEILNPWRVMLAEKLYAGDDSRLRGSPGGRQRRREESHATATDPESTEAVQADPGAPGQGMSRSARRRRNRQKNREKRLTEAAAQAGREIEQLRDPVLPDMMDEMTAAKGVASVQGAGQRKRGRGRSKAKFSFQSPEIREDADGAKPSPAEPVGEESVGERASSRHTASKAGSRGRSLPNRGQKTIPPPSFSPSGATIRSSPASSEEPEKPLTAASFYVQPKKEAEPEKKRTKKNRNPEQNGNGGNGSLPGGRTGRTSDRPLTDRAEEADTPMHWLDEI